MFIINGDQIREWAESVGGISVATGLVLQATGIGPSTAEKLVRGIYPSQPSYLVRKALVKITNIPHEKLFIRRRSVKAS
jgi:hypothetical protein